MDYVLLFMDYVLREDRGQAALPPSALEGYGPVRVIDAFVDGLDVGGLGFGRAAPAGRGVRLTNVYGLAVVAITTAGYAGVLVGPAGDRPRRNIEIHRRFIEAR
jgi:hypothetical protein